MTQLVIGSGKPEQLSPIANIAAIEQLSQHFIAFKFTPLPIPQGA
jgi:hypothetical protein